MCKRWIVYSHLVDVKIFINFCISTGSLSGGYWPPEVVSGPPNLGSRWTGMATNFILIPLLNIQYAFWQPENFPGHLILEAGGRFCKKSDALY